MHHDGHEKNLLVVEDDGDIRDALTQILEDEGYVVRAAANGREAIERLHAGDDCALILLDLMMPVMDGWEFRRQQCSDPELADIPVVVLSADASAPRRVESLGCIADFLRKPVQLDVLLDTIARHTAARG